MPAFLLRRMAALKAGIRLYTLTEPSSGVLWHRRVRCCANATGHR